MALRRRRRGDCGLRHRGARVGAGAAAGCHGLSHQSADPRFCRGASSKIDIAQPRQSSCSKRNAMPELLQQNCTPERLARGADAELGRRPDGACARRSPLVRKQCGSWATVTTRCAGAQGRRIEVLGDHRGVCAAAEGVTMDTATQSQKTAIDTSGFRFLHTMLRVFDLDRSLDFYTRLLGMKLIRRLRDCSPMAVATIDRFVVSEDDARPGRFSNSPITGTSLEPSRPRHRLRPSRDRHGRSLRRVRDARQGRRSDPAPARPSWNSGASTSPHRRDPDWVQDRADSAAVTGLSTATRLTCAARPARTSRRVSRCGAGAAARS